MARKLNAKIGVLGSFTLFLILIFQNCSEGFDVAKQPGQVNDSVNINSLVEPRILGFADASQQRLSLKNQYRLDDAVVSEEFIKTLNNDVSTNFQKPQSNDSPQAAIMTYSLSVTSWMNGQIKIFFDTSSGFNSTEFNQLKSNVMEACARWAEVGRINCTEVNSANGTDPHLTVTQAQVPLAWVSGTSGLCADASAKSCATIGFQGANGRSYLAIHKSHLNNKWTYAHEFGHVLGLSHEHQRPGRDAYITFRADLKPDSDANFKVLSALPPVNNDYDFASIMHYPTAGQFNTNFLNNTGSVLMAFKTAEMFEKNYPAVRSGQNYSSGSAGARVNLPGYPSPQDAKNISLLYGAPTNTKKSCMLSGGQSIPHGSRIGVYSSQTQTSASPYCEDEPRICNNGTLIGGDGSEGQRACAIRCLIAGQQVAYGNALDIFDIQNGTSSECQAKKKNVKCTFANLGASNATDGFLSCSALVSIVNGVCGASQGLQVPTAPTTGLCKSGDSTSVTLSSDKFLWKCNGANGGSSAECFANKGSTGNLTGTVKGYLDRLTPDGKVEGWACVTQHEPAIGVHIYYGGPAGSGGTFIQGGAANIPGESLVAQSCGTQSNAHMFSIKLTAAQLKQVGSSKIFVHGIHPDNMDKKNLAIERSGELTFAQPGTVLGNIERLTSDGKVEGWACVTQHEPAIGVHIYYGGPAGSGGTFIQGGAANIPAESLVAQSCGTQSTAHRFSIQLTAAQLQQVGSSKIFVHGIHPENIDKKHLAIEHSGHYSFK